MFILALQTDSGRLYWGGMRELHNDQGYRWQENPHQACCFRELILADEYRREIGHDSALIVDFEDERTRWRNIADRKDALHAALLAHPVRATFLIADVLPSDVVTHIATTCKES